MGCSGKGFVRGPVMVYSAQDATTWLFYALTGTLGTASIDATRVALELANRSGPMRLQPALQYSNDGITWDTAIYFGPVSVETELTADGVVYESVFTALPGTPKTFVRFGVRVRNTTGTAFACGLASLRVETRGA